MLVSGHRVGLVVEETASCADRQALPARTGLAETPLRRLFMQIDRRLDLSKIIRGLLVLE